MWALALLFTFALRVRVSRKVRDKAVRRIIEVRARVRVSRQVGVRDSRKVRVKVGVRDSRKVRLKVGS